MKKLLFSILLIGIVGCASVTPEQQRDFRQQYIQQNQSTPQKIKQAILEGKMIKGMTPDQVSAALGGERLLFVDQWDTPNNKYKIAEASVASSDGRIYTVKLYFLDGKLNFYELR